MGKVAFQSPATDTGKTARFYVVRPADDYWWNALTQTWEPYIASNYVPTKYLTPMTETGATARFSAPFPSGIAAGTVVDVTARFDALVGRLH